MVYVIAEPCIGTKDTTCVDACPVDCIHPKKRPATTTIARASMRFPSFTSTRWSVSTAAPVCPSGPVSAMFTVDDLPEKWKHYTELNASYVEGGKFRPDEFAKHAGK